MPVWLLTALAAFATALGRVTAGLMMFSRGLASATARVTTGAARGTAGAAVRGAGYLSSELASNNFLMRRVSWAAYHTATAGVQSLQVGAAASFKEGGGFESGSNALTANVLSQINDKFGVNIGRIAQTEAAGADVQRLTERIAEVGGVVPDELRETYFKHRFEAQQRIMTERNAVSRMVNREFGEGATLQNGEQAVQDLNRIAREILIVLKKIPGLGGN